MFNLDYGSILDAIKRISSINRTTLSKKNIILASFFVTIDGYHILNFTALVSDFHLQSVRMVFWSSIDFGLKECNVADQAWLFAVACIRSVS